MKGLLIKDLLILRKTLKTTLLIALFFFIFSFSTDNPSYLISMVVLLFTVMPITSIAFDKMANWNGFALAMPISKVNIVTSKYVLAIMLAASSAMLSSLLALIISLLRSPVAPGRLALVAAGSFSVSLFFISLMLPLIYRFGVERSRIIAFSIFALPAVLLPILAKAGVQMPNEEQLLFLLKISPAALVVFLLISALASYNIFKKQEV